MTNPNQPQAAGHLSVGEAGHGKTTSGDFGAIGEDSVMQTVTAEQPSTQTEQHSGAKLDLRGAVVHDEIDRTGEDTKRAAKHLESPATIKVGDKEVAFNPVFATMNHPEDRKRS